LPAIFPSFALVSPAVRTYRDPNGLTKQTPTIAQFLKQAN
jgi:hypothetical protein